MLTDAKIAAIRPPKSGQQEYPDKKVTGLRLRVGATGKKSWTVRRRVGAKIINRKLGTYPAMKLAAARVAAEKLIEALERDGGTEGLDRTFGEVAADWIKKKRGDKSRNKSLHLQERRIELHVLPHWRDRKIAEIKRRDVRDLIDGIEGDVVPNRVLTVIKTVFRHALSRDWIDASPVEGIPKPRDEAPRDRFLTMPELTRVWRAAEQIGYPSGTWLRLLILTGQRRNEVAGMRWDSLDLTERSWMLTPDETKAARAHLVPLSPFAAQILEDAPEIGAFVHTSDGETHIRNFAQTKRMLDAIIASKGGALEPWTFHDLRRTMGYHLARLGIQKDLRSRLMNHALEGVTDRHYNPYDYAAEKRHALDVWAAEVDRAVNGDKGENVVAING